MGTNLFTLHSCGSCGLPIEKTCLCRVYPHLLTPVHPQTMVNTQQTSTTVATSSIRMVLYCMNTLKIAKNCFYDVYVHIFKMCIRY